MPSVFHFHWFPCSISRTFPPFPLNCISIQHTQKTAVFDVPPLSHIPLSLHLFSSPLSSSNFSTSMISSLLRSSLPPSRGSLPPSSQILHCHRQPLGADGFPIDRYGSSPTTSICWNDPPITIYKTFFISKVYTKILTIILEVLTIQRCGSTFLEYWIVWVIISIMINHLTS